MKICVAGALGRMGRRVMESAHLDGGWEIGGAFDLPEKAGTNLVIGGDGARPLSVVLASNAQAAVAGCDVLIDFTAPSACLANVRAAAEQGKSAVVGTTGLSAGQQDELRKLAATIAVVFAPNMSVGVNLLFKLTHEVAKVLGQDYNVEIVEVHHNQKKDAPSGTALRLAECAAEGLGLAYPEGVLHGREGLTGERPRAQIGMHALRGGDVAGEHTVSFFGQGERIELVHKAHSRDNFARGALVAAKYAVKAKPGLYDMQDVLGLR